MNPLDDLKLFLDSAKTSWHAVHELSLRLKESGFIPLVDTQLWHLESGKSYYLAFQGALVAFSVPEQEVDSLRILASHTDSPALKIKPHPELYTQNLTRFGVEVYGAPLLSSWFNRDLAIAGKIVTKDGVSKLVYLDETLATIPQLAIHLDRKVNEEGLLINKQEALPALVSSLSPISLEEYLGEEILSSDLFLVPVEKSCYLGKQQELLASYRIDNLIGCYASLSSLIESSPSESTLQMALFLDHEEIGSRSYSGAASCFAKDLIDRILLHLDIAEEEVYPIKRRSKIVSVDLAHALHPAFAQRMDPNHSPQLGSGIVIKYNADLKYATTAEGAAWIIQSCKEARIPFQSFCARSDASCGSTIGPILSSSLGMETVDIGIAQLSMHSIREIISCQDYLYLNRLLTHLLEENDE